MQIVRKFKKMNLWDFIDLMNEKCIGSCDKVTYFLFLDEIKLRRLESISEGGDLKLRSMAKTLLKEFIKEASSNKSFASQGEIDEFHEIVLNEI